MSPLKNEFDFDKRLSNHDCMLWLGIIFVNYSIGQVNRFIDTASSERGNMKDEWKAYRRYRALHNEQVSVERLVRLKIYSTKSTFPGHQQERCPLQQLTFEESKINLISSTAQNNKTLSDYRFWKTKVSLLGMTHWPRIAISLIKHSVSYLW